jgi:pimeloyl-ACP methyl ester carboxylesterase
MTPTDVVDLLRAGDFTEIHELFAPRLRPLVPADAVRAAWTAALAEHGPLTAVGTPARDGGVTRIPLTFEHGQLTLLVTMSDAGQLGGLQLAPASAAEPVEPWQPPSYVDTSSFGERDVTLGSGPLAVGGTLSTPRRPGRFPAAVLLGGSGPNDRDETIARNKPLKDLAWGLASRGVAVLRFDKVTHAHPAEVTRDPHFTVADEYLPAASAAVALLRDDAAVERIHLVGHSLGGTIAPRVAAREPAVRGLVLLAAGAQPLHWAAVRQFRHLASIHPASASEATIEAITRQATMVDSPDLSVDTPSSELPLGVPASYWLDLRSYDGPATAAALDMPIFIAQGGRDYQATVADDLARWQAALAGRPDVTTHVYDADNHLFFPGSGPSTPDEYEPVQHLDPDVVADVARWLTRATQS